MSWLLRDLSGATSSQAPGTTRSASESLFETDNGKFIVVNKKVNWHYVTLTVSLGAHTDNAFTAKQIKTARLTLCDLWRPAFPGILKSNLSSRLQLANQIFRSLKMVRRLQTSDEETKPKDVKNNPNKSMLTLWQRVWKVLMLVLHPSPRSLVFTARCLQWRRWDGSRPRLCGEDGTWQSPDGGCGKKKQTKKHGTHKQVLGWMWHSHWPHAAGDVHIQKAKRPPCILTTNGKNRILCLFSYFFFLSPILIPMCLHCKVRQGFFFLNTFFIWCVTVCR